MLHPLLVRAGLQQSKLVRMQQNGWCDVGFRGKHKHCPQGTIWHCSKSSQYKPKPISLHDDHASAVAKQRPANDEVDESVSLISLPGIALASIFHHLDYSSACSLSQTCQACAAEFSQQKPEFARKRQEELLPSITCSSTNQLDTAQYGTQQPSVSVQVQWQGREGSSSKAMHQIHALSSEAGFLKDLWRAAWSSCEWGDLWDKQSPKFGHDEDFGPIYDWGLTMHVDLNILIESNTALRVSWEWLSEQFLGTCATALTELLQDAGPRRMTHLDLRLYRPAKAGRFQSVMSEQFTYSDSDYNDYETYSVLAYSMYDWPEPVFQPVLSDHMQQVTVTAGVADFLTLTGH